MQLVFIHGPAASGKLTVARELADLTGLPLFHNHLVVDMLLAVFEFGSPPFVELRESTWLRVFERAVEEGLHGLIFTFTLERTVRQDFVGAVVTSVEEAGGKVQFVELTCTEEELERRIENDSRSHYEKLRSLEMYRSLRERGAFAYPPLPDSGLNIDTTELSPAASARRIADHFGIPTSR